MFDKLKSTISNLVFWNSSAKSVDLSWGDGMPFYPLSNSSYAVKRLSATDYLRLYTGIAFRCVNTISDAVGKLKYQLKSSPTNDKQIDNYLLSLVWFEFFKAVVSFLQLNGTCYVYPVKIWNKIESLEFLRSDMIVIENKENGF